MGSAFDAGQDDALDQPGGAAVYTANGQVLPPNGTLVSGREAVQSFWQGVMDMGIKNVTLETVELEPCGDDAYEVGQATLFGEGVPCWTPPSSS